MVVRTITFDTLKFANRLKAAGVAPAQAEAETEALAEVFEANLGDLITRGDLRDLATKGEVLEVGASLQELRAEVEGKFRLLQRVLGLLLGGVVVLILKAFF